MKSLTLTLGFLFASVLIDPAAAAEPQSTGIVHEGPSVSIPVDKINFIQTGVKAKGLELKAGPAYGNLGNGRHGTFVVMPAGFASDIHVHTEDYYAVVIRGVGTNHAPGEKDVALPVGSYWFQKGEEKHVTKCLSKTDCLFFIVQPGKFDYVLSTRTEK